MTSCIAPKADLPIKRTDPRLRLEDYKQGLKFWMEVPAPRIGAVVFADNSGYPLDEIEHFARTEVKSDRPIEFISFNQPAPSTLMSYGHTEFALVDMVHDRSTLLARYPYFIKATGRYKFPAIARLTAKLPSEYKIAADCRGMRPFGMKAIPLLIVSLLPINTRFYLEEIRKFHTTMVPAPPWTRQQFVEAVLFDLLYPRRHETGIHLRWPCNCDPEGIGANGDNYYDPKRRFLYALRGMARVLLPRLWI